MKTSLMIAIGVSLFLPNLGLGQMEKRKAEFFGEAEFYATYPTIGTKAPELEVKTLDGKTVSLSNYLGKNVVLIKGSYT